MIFKKILDIQDELPAILKDRKFLQNGKEIYKFRGIDDLYNKLHPMFKKYRVFMTPEIVNCESSEKAGREGRLLFYEKMTIRYRLYAEDGSYVEASTRGIGMDSGDKAGNKAMSVAQKYALIQIFSIPTDEQKDPESDGQDVINHNYDVSEISRKLQNCKTGQDVKDLFTLYESPENPDVKALFTKRYNQVK